MIFANFFMQYALPAIVVTLIAALLALGLSFLGHKLSIQRDERIDQIRELLSGANCGGCGYPGCDAYAEALFKGEVGLDKCNPTSGESKALIANIMGVKAEASEPMTAIVHCNGGHKCKDKGGYVGYGDCQSANMLSGGTKACSVACMGLGSCEAACRFDAVGVNKDTALAEVNRNCTACRACIEACPKHIIGLIPRSAKVYVACSNTLKGKAVLAACEVGCVACGMCERVCPHAAIKVIDNLAIIDYTKCTGCGACVAKCPRHTIVAR